MDAYDAPPSGMQIAHALAFSAGLVAMIIGTFTNHGVWYVIAGPCLVLSGALILVGCRLTFRGPVGDALRAVLGASKVRRLNLRAVVWVIAGLWISVYGVERMRAERNVERDFNDPVAARNLPVRATWTYAPITQESP
jgi:hypothetical protein